MDTTEQRDTDGLMRHVARRIEQTDRNLEYQDERFLSWLARDLRMEQTSTELRQDYDLADEFARRVSTRLAGRKTASTLRQLPLRLRAAPVTATVAQSLPFATRNRCATLLDLSVAAGAGRELWDEPCDRWLELPEDVPAGRYVALKVAGDSMVPVLDQRDVILIQLDTTPRVDDLIVARLPDQSHVVKRVASIRNGKLELASFNPDYEPVFVSRDDPSLVVGTVIARFTHEM
jgi:phage repressor protein C with HTH and peptisase S24 domain